MAVGGAGTATALLGAGIIGFGGGAILGVVHSVGRVRNFTIHTKKKKQ